MTVDSGDFGALFEKALKQRREGFEEQKSGKQGARQAARSRRRQLHGSHRAAEQGDGRHPLRRGRRRDDDHRHARLRPGTRGAVCAGAVARGWACRSRGSACCRAIPTSSSFGAGTGGSRSAMMGGGALAQASELVIRKARSSRRGARGRRGRSSSFATAVSSCAAPIVRFPWMNWRERYPGKLDVKHVTEVIPSAFPNGCHVCEVEIDPDTGAGRRGALQLGERLRHGAQPAHGRGPDPRRRGAGHRPVPDGERALRLEAASFSPARSWTTRCRAPRTSPARDRAGRAIRCRRPPIRSAPRAAARRAAPASMTSVMNAVVDALRGVGIYALRHAGYSAARLAGDPARSKKPSKETESFGLGGSHRYRHVVVTAISTKTVGNYVSNSRTQGQQIFTLRVKTVQIKNWADFFFATTGTCAKESASVQCRRTKTSVCSDSFRALDNFRAAGRRSSRRARSGRPATRQCSRARQAACGARNRPPRESGAGAWSSTRRSARPSTRGASARAE